MKGALLKLCFIQLLSVGAVVLAQNTVIQTGPNGGTWYENKNVIVAGGPAPAAGVVAGSSVAATNTNAVAYTNFVEVPVPVTNAPVHTIIPQIGGATGGAVPAAGRSATALSTVTGTGIGPDTTIGGAAGVNPPGVGVTDGDFIGGGTVGTTTAAGSGGSTTGTAETVGGLGTASGGTGTGVNGPGGLGTGSSGMGTGQSGVGGLGTGSSGVGTGVGSAPIPGVSGTGAGLGSGVGPVGGGMRSTGPSGTGVGGATGTR